MSKFLNYTVPSKESCYHDLHWIHTFAPKLKNLETLTLSGCGCYRGDLSRLRGWIDSLDIKVEGGEQEEDRDPIHQMVADSVAYPYGLTYYQRFGGYCSWGDWM